MSQTRIVIIGAGYAGLVAAVRLAGKTRRQNVVITLVNAVDVFVERLRLHQFAANQPIQQYRIADRLRGTGVNFVQGYVTHIDTTRREVVTQNSRIGYDTLVYALGSTIDRDSIKGVREHAYTLTPAGALSAAALREALPALNAKGGRFIVVGGGATGIEAAAEFAAAYPRLSVQLVTRGTFGAFMPPAIAHYMRQSLQQRGVTIRDQTTVSEVRANEIQINSGETIACDVCLWAGGFTTPPLARESGLTVNELGQILTDPYLRSISHPEIYAVGDAAQPVEEPGVRLRMAAFTAVILGAHAADNISAALRGKTPKPLSFAYMGQGIALGPHKAIGFNNFPDDTPNAPFFTGCAGYEMREFFVRFLADLPNWERRMPGFFLWLGKGRYAAQKRRARGLVKQSV